MTTEYSGRGNPARTFELLWGTRERPSRGPKPSLSLARIVQAAIALADAEGLEALSMRRVAERLGVTTMALYRYVPGKAELLDVMSDTVVGELAHLDEVEGDWRAKLEHLAREDWSGFHRHPWALQIAVNRPIPGPNGLAQYESALRALSGIGLNEREMTAIYHTIFNFVRGTARVSVDMAQAEQRTGISDDQWWAERAGVFEPIFASGRYPTLVRVIQAGAYDPPADGGEPAASIPTLSDFEFGLRCLLDGIEQFVRSRSGSAEPVPSEA
jgi:AcrR family transcriptional regulator